MTSHRLTQAEAGLLDAFTHGRAWSPTEGAVPAPGSAYDAQVREAPQRQISPDLQSLRDDEIRADFIRALIICDAALLNGAPAPTEEARYLEARGVDPLIRRGFDGLVINALPVLAEVDIKTVAAEFEAIEDPHEREWRIRAEYDWRRYRTTEKRAKIIGNLELRGVRYPKPIRLSGCDFRLPSGHPADIVLQEAQIASLNLVASDMGVLDCDQIQLENDFEGSFLSAVRAEFRGARLGGLLNLHGGRLSNPGRIALDCDGADIRRGVFIRNGFQCEGTANFIAATIGENLDADGGRFEQPGGVALNCPDTQIGLKVFIGSYFRAVGRVSFKDSAIGSDFAASTAHFDGEGELALYCAGLKVGGEASLNRVRSENGQISFIRASIERALNLSGAVLKHSEDALVLNGAVIGSSVFVDDTSITGGLDMVSVRIGGILRFSGGRFEAEDTPISLFGASIGRHVFFQGGLETQGRVSFTRCQVTGNFDLQNCTLRNADGCALELTGAQIRGRGRLCTNFRTEGHILLANASFEDDLELAGAEIKAPGRFALAAHAVAVAGSVNLKSAEIEGGVDFSRARIGETLSFTNGRFSHPEGVAISLNGGRVDGSVFLRGAEGKNAPKCDVKGQIDFTAARIGRYLHLDRGRFEAGATDSVALNFYGMEVEGALRFDTVDAQNGCCEVIGDIDLSQARCGVLDDAALRKRASRKDWLKGVLRLDGFVYKRLGVEAPISNKARLNWLKRQAKKDLHGRNFKPQPFEQAERVLREMGHTQASREIGLSKQWRLHDVRRIGLGSWIFRALFQTINGYGYRPLWTFGVALFFVALSTAVFESSYRAGYMEPAEPHEAINDLVRQGRGDFTTPAPLEQADEFVPTFNSFVYTLDIFLPLIELDQEAAWKPTSVARDPSRLQTSNPEPYWWRWTPVRNAANFAGETVRAWTPGLSVFKWAMVALGFILTTLIATALSGLFKRE